MEKQSTHITEAKLLIAANTNGKTEHEILTFLEKVKSTSNLRKNKMAGEHQYNMALARHCRYIFELNKLGYKFSTACSIVTINSVNYQQLLSNYIRPLVIGYLEKTGELNRVSKLLLFEETIEKGCWYNTNDINELLQKLFGNHATNMGNRRTFLNRVLEFYDYEVRFSNKKIVGIYFNCLRRPIIGPDNRLNLEKLVTEINNNIRYLFSPMKVKRSV